MTPIFDSMDKPEAVLDMDHRVIDGADLIDLRRKLTAEEIPEERAWVRSSKLWRLMHTTAPWDAPFPFFSA